jgi:hypothetical protein
MDMKYEVIEHRQYQGQWNVEAFDDEGCCYIVAFTGPKAEQRARSYADGMNG